MRSARIHVLTGDGRGKTTSAAGTALRTVGHGGSCLFCQFMKGAMFSGEVAALERFAPLVEVRRYGPLCSRGHISPLPRDCGNCRECWLTDSTRTRHAQLAGEGLAHAMKSLRSGGWNLVVLDELCTALHENLVSGDEVRAGLENAECDEVIITGRNAPRWLTEMADVVSKVVCVKYNHDSTPRAGIEY
ncbi:MAG: cob(I)yrinic acid a,c-diamide adenosyltransferase [Planctomycetota bacterium]|nr:cob(I)yrinic acid a,c-diamide adenosyltransferase [Planctomycetota bacterium]